MNYLLDTQILLWLSAEPSRLPRRAYQLISDSENVLLFSAASIWEVAIKSSQPRSNLDVHPTELRGGLSASGYIELPITGAHAVAVRHLPVHHKDPFDRLLLAQAICEGLTLVTTDGKLGDYDGPILKV